MSNVIWADDIPALPWEPWHYMACPDCGRVIPPYGGFGEHPAWVSVGKYHCDKHRWPGNACGRAWYGDPRTGVIYERARHGYGLVPISGDAA